MTIQLTSEQLLLVSRINKLKKQKNAIILAHNYQRSEIYEVADEVGDSLGLCQKAAQTKKDIIVFCGVYFMAESARILNPDKRVFVPDFGAGCALSDTISAEALRGFKSQYPEAGVVCYINSPAEVKAESDIICTSSNALEAVRSLPQKQILMVPDKNLALNIAPKVPEKEIIPWHGFCPIHHRITGESLKRAKESHPNAEIIAHPECQPDVVAVADHVSSTSKMVDYARASKAQEFIIITECGMVNRMKQEVPGKTFYTTCSMCFDMKKNTLEKILDSLENERFEVDVSPEVCEKAKKAFDRMFELALS